MMTYFVYWITGMYINSLPNEKFLDWSKLKGFADNKINVTEKLNFELGRVENIVEKGENAGYQHSLVFQQCLLPILKLNTTIFVTFDLLPANTIILVNQPSLRCGNRKYKVIIKTNNLCCLVFDKVSNQSTLFCMSKF